MSRVLLLAWRHVSYHKLKTLILVTCLTLTAVLPLTAHFLIKHYNQALRARAAETPLILGAKGNRFDLVLKTLYFTTAQVDPVYMAELERIGDFEYVDVLAIPMNIEFTARGYPIVGTSLEYFEFRKLEVAAGSMPHRMGQAVVGAEVAAELGLKPGDSLFSDQHSLYDITRTYPLKMHTTGVLAPTGSPDDRAVFVDVKTAWIIAGISHGHQDVTKTDDPAVILQRTDEEVVTNASIYEYNEVTDENIASFHTHAEPDQLPLTAIIVVPADQKSATIFRGYYESDPTAAYRVLHPLEVVEDLMSVVFNVKRFFDASFGFVAVSTVLFLALVVVLSHRLRRDELETIFKLGCSRWTSLWMQVTELAIVLAISVIVTGVLGTLAAVAAPQLVEFL